MKSRRRLAVMTAALLAIGTVAVAQLPPGGSFLDDNGSVHEGNIEAIAAADITRGCNPPDNNLFCPDDHVTRGQMAAFLVRAMGFTDDGGGDRFTDDDGSVFEGDIDRLATAGVTLGCNPPDNTRFCPEDSVTRGQMAAFLVRAMGYTDDGGGDRFTDDDGSVFEGDIDRLATAGVTLGCNPPDNSRFCPGELVSRAQMASFLARALDLEPITPPPPTLPENNLCTGTVGEVDLDDTLIVPNGATCDLVGTAIDGNLLVRSGATLTASGVNVIGNIQADGHATVVVGDNSFVNGDVQAEQGGAVSVGDSMVNGNIQLETNSGELSVVRNSVGGDVQVNSNTGGAEISDNAIDGNLQCEDNNPAPIGSGNQVEGDKEEQCAGL